MFVKDGKFIAIGKENVAAKKETERLIMSKNIGKQFITSTTSAGAGRQQRLDILHLFFFFVTKCTVEIVI